MSTFVVMPLFMDRDGIVCLDCDRPIPLGAEHSQRLEGWLDSIQDFLVELVCLDCAGMTTGHAVQRP